MKKLPAIVSLLGMLLSGGFGALGQQSAPTAHPKIGDPAPDFELRDQNRNLVRLSDFEGKKNVVLAFYVLAFTGG